MFNINRFSLAGFLWSLTSLTVEFSDLSIYINFIIIFISSLFILKNELLFIPHKFYLLLQLLIIYISINILSLFYNSFTDFTFILNFVLLFYVVVVTIILSNNLEYFNKFIIGLMFGGSISIIYYLFFIDSSLIISPYYRFSTKMNANGIASTLLFLMVVYLYWLKNKSKFYINKIALIILVLLALIIILYTKSRTSIILSIFAILFYQIKSKKFIYVGLLCFAFVIFSNADRMVNFLRIDNENEYEVESMNTLSGRTEIWNKTFTLIKKQPILGYGAQNAFIEVEGRKLHSHNALLQIIFESGILGLIPIVLILILNIKSLFINKICYNSLFKLIFVLGFIRMTSENKLFNFGTMGSLLFFISIVLLSTSEYNKNN